MPTLHILNSWDILDISNDEIVQIIALHISSLITNLSGWYIEIKLCSLANPTGYKSYFSNHSTMYINRFFNEFVGQCPTD